MDIDYNSLSENELRNLIARAEKALSTLADRRKAQALKEVEETARTLGFTLAQLTGVELPKSGKRAAQGEARFANPANSAETWTGRGRQPAWFAAALAEGKTRESMAI